MKENSNVGAGFDVPQGQTADAPAGSGEAIVVAPQGHTSRASPHADTIALIRGWHRQCQFAIGQQVRADNACGAYVRTVAGWSLGRPEAERTAIAAQAARIIATVRAAAHLEEADKPIAAEVWDVIAAAEQARRPWDEVRSVAEREIVRLARTLPAAGFVEGAKGFGWLSFARVIGEAGDLAAYPTQGHLWKRMGMAVLDGVRQGGLRKGASADDWVRHGYAPHRRALMFVIGESLIKATDKAEDGTRAPAPYARLYRQRLAVEHAKALDDGLLPATTTKATVESWAARGLPALTLVKKTGDEHRAAMHMHSRAKRWVEKRLLRDLWRAWREEANRELS